MLLKRFPSLMKTPEIIIMYPAMACGGVAVHPAITKIAPPCCFIFHNDGNTFESYLNIYA